MAAARSKGWQLMPQERTDVMVLERSVPASTIRMADNVAVHSRGQPRIRIETNFQAHPRGVLVIVHAALIINAGMPNEQWLDYSDQYAEALAISLDSLQTAWMQASLNTLTAPSVITSDLMAPNVPSVDDFLSTGPSESSSEQTNQIVPLASEAIPKQGQDSTQPLATITPDQQQQPPPQSNQFMTLATPPPQPKPVLPSTTQQGQWAYYAEQSARQAGCELATQGAILLRRNSHGELHEVYCLSGASLLLNCQADQCRILQ
jgi:hypothetical protein